MARKPKDNGSRKFGAPLYCAAWPAGAYPIVGGGGGKRSSGIPNRFASSLPNSPSSYLGSPEYRQLLILLTCLQGYSAESRERNVG